MTVFHVKKAKQRHKRCKSKSSFQRLKLWVFSMESTPKFCVHQMALTTDYTLQNISEGGDSNRNYSE